MVIKGNMRKGNSCLLGVNTCHMVAWEKIKKFIQILYLKGNKFTTLFAFQVVWILLGREIVVY